MKQLFIIVGLAIMLQSSAHVQAPPVVGMNSIEQHQLEKITVGAEYEHYKGKRYKILGVFRHTEDLKLHVCYEALYDCGEYGNYWARPLEMFVENIEINGIEQPRFKKV